MEAVLDRAVARFFLIQALQSAIPRACRRGYHGTRVLAGRVESIDERLWASRLQFRDNGKERDVSQALCCFENVSEAPQGKLIDKWTVL
jgi:hypothetical protein